MSETQAGKGDRARNNHSPAFRSNYDEINWRRGVDLTGAFLRYQEEMLPRGGILLINPLLLTNQEEAGGNPEGFAMKLEAFKRKISEDAEFAKEWKK